MSQLSLSNVINISVAVAQRGIGQYNTSNLAIFTSETPSVSFTDGYKIYLTPSEVVADFPTDAVTGQMATKIFSQTPNILTGGGYLVVIPLLTDETIKEAVIRTKDLVQYFGILTDTIIGNSDISDAASTVQALNKMLFLAKKTEADVTATTGIADIVRLAGYSKTRILPYLTDATTDTASVLYSAAYAGRALSTDFTGSNTTQTMHMKDLVGILPDLAMTQTIFEKAKAAGADTYCSFQGVPKVFSTGANKFFDEVYNLCWLVGALEVAGFNFLAQTNTKIPQSEKGVDGLKGAYRSVLEQSITNQYAASGSWNSPDTFGDLADFHRNINERGYYIYSLPVNQQSQADRAARKAPLVQIAVKAAGAVHSSNVIVNINA